MAAEYTFKLLIAEQKKRKNGKDDPNTGGPEGEASKPKPPKRARTAKAKAEKWVAA